LRGHVGEQERFTVLDFQLIMIGTGDKVAAIVDTALIGFEPSTEPAWNANVSPKIILSLDFPFKLRIWIDDLQYPFGQPEIP